MWNSAFETPSHFLSVLIYPVLACGHLFAQDPFLDLINQWLSEEDSVCLNKSLSFCRDNKRVTMKFRLTELRVLGFLGFES